MGYASDTRGTRPFMPKMRGRRIRGAQMPTTLPTLDELVGVNGITVENVAEHLLKLTAGRPRRNTAMCTPCMRSWKAWR